MGSIIQGDSVEAVAVRVAEDLKTKTEEQSAIGSDVDTEVQEVTATEEDAGSHDDTVEDPNPGE